MLKIHNIQQHKQKKMSINDSWYQAIILAPKWNHKTTQLVCDGGWCEITFLNQTGQTLGKKSYHDQEQIHPFPSETFQIKLKYQGEHFHLTEFYDVEILTEPQNDEIFIPEPCLLGNHTGELYRSMRTLRDGTRMGECSNCCQTTTSKRRNETIKAKPITDVKKRCVY